MLWYIFSSAARIKLHFACIYMCSTVSIFQSWATFFSLLFCVREIESLVHCTNVSAYFLLSFSLPFLLFLSLSHSLSDVGLEVSIVYAHCPLSCSNVRACFFCIYMFLYLILTFHTFVGPFCVFARVCVCVSECVNIVIACIVRMRADTLYADDFAYAFVVTNSVLYGHKSFCFAVFAITRIGNRFKRVKSRSEGDNMCQNRNE